MKILFIHSDHLEYRVREKAIENPEPVELQEESVDEVLVCFISVETSDSESMLNNVATEIKDVALKVKATKLVLYPYAHLSSDLADPETAKKLLKELEGLLNKEYEVHRAPFGWYKSFTISCKGHPLSELSKSIKEDLIPEAVKAEEKIISYWKILKDGKLEDVDDFNFSDHKDLKTFADYEISGTRAVKEIPPHVVMMQQLELVGYEEGSDGGNFRYYPKGKMIKALLEEYVTKKVQEYGAMEVETPIMYDYEHPALKSYLQRFPARQYTLLSGENKFFLRFSACFGQFLIAKDSVITYKQLPVRIYELAKYSFRREKSGELVGLRRLRAFTMPDMHTLTLDLNNAKEEFLKQYKFAMEVLKEIGIEDYEVAVRFTKEFWENNKEFIQELERIIKKPILVQMWNDRFFYFILKFEFNFIDTMQKAAALSTVQIDVENAKRFEITYYAEDSSKKYPYILHCSPSGAIERLIYAILENQEKRKQNGQKAMFPLWLAPTQVRIIPVSESFFGYCEKLARKLNSDSIRADFDDRELTMQKKIREAEKEWVPYIVVIGEKEIQNEKLNVRIRETGGIKEYSYLELKREIHNLAGSYPFRAIPENEKLSMRIKFS
ncbi:MAG: threonine--tRNA ligase [Thermoplasmata archaeon]